MAQLAIKGHKTRGNEVIEILEMLGGRNDINYVGELPNYAYAIDKRGIIDWHVQYEHNSIQYNTFTLEEFLEKFPYKIGDKVQHKGATSYGSVFEVEKMHWEGDTVMYTLCLFGCNYKRSTLPAEYLQPYKEETMDKAVFDANAQCCDIMNHLIKKETIEGKITMNEDKGTLVAIDLTMDFRKADEIEVILGDYEFVLKDGKTYFVKKNKYPNTYEECCKILNIPVNGNIIYAGNWTYGGEYLDKHLDIIRKFQQLLICRDAYWKIAGEQMGLGKPWEFKLGSDSKEVVYAISVFGTGIMLDFYYALNCNKILVFPTEEMRNSFYDNFKDLIEECKEFL